VKTVTRSLLTAALLLFGSRTVVAQTIKFTGGPSGTLQINSAVAGQNPTSAPGAGTFSTLTKGNQGTLRIQAKLDQAMPANTTLVLSLTYPFGTNQGAKALGITPVDMIISITPPAGNNITTVGTVSYSFTATPSAGVVAPFSRTVTLTIGP